MEILITISWKTYKVARKHSPVPSVLNTYIDSGDLEEVKENQKILDIDKKLTEKFIKDNVICTPCESPAHTLAPLIERLQNAKPWSMIELSKEEMEKMIKPIEDKIELPEFNRKIVEEKAMDRHAEQVITLAWISDILVEQVELLTNVVSKLIKQN